LRGADQGVVVIPVIVGIAKVETEVVRIQVEAERAEVVVVLPETKCAKYHLCHHPLNSLWIESNLGSSTRQYLAPSIFIFEITTRL